jgi:hypothetical protein
MTANRGVFVRALAASPENQHPLARDEGMLGRSSCDELQYQRAAPASMKPE